jgi:hypothetical protein
MIVFDIVLLLDLALNLAPRPLSPKKKIFCRPSEKSPSPEAVSTANILKNASSHLSELFIAIVIRKMGIKILAFK